MIEGIPIVFIALTIILLAVAVFGYLAWRRYRSNGLSLFTHMNKKVFLLQRSTGIISSLFAAFLMFSGDIFGDDTTSITRIIGIVGIILIATTAIMARAFRSKPVSE